MRSGDRTRQGVLAGARSSVWSRRPATAAEIAWLAAVPCALATVVAIVVLGPPLGRLLPGGHVTPWPSTADSFLPEPTEHARYALALLAPLLLTAAIVLAARRPLRLPRAVAWAVPAVQALALGFLVVCIVVQRGARFEARYTEIVGTSPRTVYFTFATLVVACAVGLAIAAGAHSRGTAARVQALLRDTPRRAVVAWAIAAAAIAISLLPAIEFEGTLLRANVNTWYHVMFTFDETSAVLDGRSPLVDFAAQYGSLWPYSLALAMSVVGTSVGAFTILTSLLTGGAMLAVFAVLRRVTASALGALALFLPLLATSFYLMNGSLERRFSLATLTGIYPLRLAGPCLLLWLTARHLDAARPRGRLPLFLLAGLVVLNNVEFGLPALGATLAALLWTGALSRRALGVLAAELAGGLAGAFALVTVVTLVHAGSLPHLGLLVRYADLFAGSGFGMLPLTPAIGVSTIVYLTYLAAIGTASVRAVGGSSDRLLTGLLAWSGVFGLGIGAYYVGRSHPEVLTNMFPAWALCLVLLLVAVLRTIAGRPARLPSLAELACLVGFGVLVCSLAQLPAPWSQVSRLGATTSTRIAPASAVRFVAAQTRDGAPVAILVTVGHRLADEAGATDVTPYTGMESMPTREQLDETLRALRAAGGHTVIAAIDEATPEVVPALERAGFHLAGVDDAAGLQALSDR